MKRIVYLLVLLAMPTMMFADSFTLLWKKATEAGAKDLPKTQIEWLKKIISKAERERAYGHLLKAQFQYAGIQTTLSPDSLEAEAIQLEQKAIATKDDVLRAVYATALGKMYQQTSGEDAPAKSKAWFARSMENPGLLAKHKSTVYEPAIVAGMDSKIFYDDLLHVVGLEGAHYSALRTYYATHGNRAAECLMALFELRQNRKMDATRMRKSSYLQAVDSLIKTYGDLREAGEIAIEHYECMSGCIDVTAEDRVNYINYALSRWGAWPRMNILRNALKDIEQPSFNINIGDYMLLPNMPRTIRINSIRNINELNISIYRLNVKGDTRLNPARKEDYAKLQKLLRPDAVQTAQRRYIGQSAWKENSDSITLKGMPVGVYLMEAATDNTDIAPQRALLRVSNLYALHEGLPGRKIRIVAVDATTGKPVPNAHIVLSAPAYAYENTEQTKLTTNRNGEAVYSYGENMPATIHVYTDDDHAYGNTDLDGYYFYNEAEPGRNIVDVFTDRSLYRPGQTLHATAIAYRTDNKTATSRALGSTPLTFTLLDANGKETATQTATTDGYGQASVTIPLPANGLTGSLTVRVSNDRLHGAAGIRVEQYKRPTFRADFDEYKQQYHAGDTIRLRGVAKSFSGMPVQGAKVEYSVMRRRPMWWRSGYGDTMPTLLSDTVKTADDGSFFVSVPMLFPEEDAEAKAHFYRIEVNAKISDTSGETHEATATLPLSNRSSVLTCNLPEKTLRDSLKSFVFIRKNAAGQDIAGSVRYHIDEGTWKTAEANRPIIFDKKTKSGRHRLVGICENDTVTQDFIIFSYTDRKPAVQTHDWFYAPDNKFHADGKPVYIQLGTTDEDVHVYYSVFSKNKELARGCKVMSNEVITQKLTYKEAYGDGILINLAWVKQGRLYTHRITLSRPEPKRKMNLEWKTFRNKLTPGQKEEWTLRILDPEGKPAKAQLLATMYDKSLDNILKHQWRFSPTYDHALPQTQWAGATNSAFGLYGFEAYKALPERSLDFSHFSNDMFLFASPYIFRTRANAMLTEANQTMRLYRAKDADPAEAKAYNRNAMTKRAAGGGNFHTSQQNPTDKETHSAPLLRQNLHETAFFFPALTTDADGCVAIRFTLPESITTWHFMGIAHDEKINHGSISADVVARKTVMVQPALPRFVRMDDKAQLSARILNTAGRKVDGAVRLQILRPESETIIAEWTKPFAVESNKTLTTSFNIDVAKLATAGGGDNLYIVRMLAEGKGFSDGEQHYLPLLPAHEYITSTIPFTQHGAGTKTIDISNLFPTADPQNTLTIEYTNNPAWLMIQALPSIANPQDKDAISLASAIYANSVGQSIVKSSPMIARAIKRRQTETTSENSLTSPLQKNEELKTMTLAETPWAEAAEKETDRRHQLATFLDENTTAYRIHEFTTKLQTLQNDDGSFSWWPGMAGNGYMTAAVVKILARLDAMTGSQYSATSWLNKAFDYLGLRLNEEVDQLKKRAKKGQKQLRPSDMACTTLYASALAKRKADSNISYLVDLLEKMPTEQTIYGKAEAAVILSQYGKKQRAREYLQSIVEYSVYKEDMGRYFDTRRASYSWFDYKIPAQVAAIEALRTLRPEDEKTVEDMQRWLLQEKRTTGWDTPLNATDAVHAFLTGRNGKTDISKLDTDTRATLMLDRQIVKWPQPTTGMGYLRTTIRAPKATGFTAGKSSEGTSWGALYARFQQKTSDVKSASSGLTISREIRTTDGKKAATHLKVGDKVRVRITIKADRDYDFVQVEDKRAACLEPVRQLSGYQHDYYYAPGDYATKYYFDHLAKGTHVVETEYYVSREGRYATGICTAQCAYSPEFSGREAAKTIQADK